MDGINFLVVEGYSTFINGDKFVCFKPRAKDYDDNGQEPNEPWFFIANYEISDNNSLVIKHFSTQKVKKLVENAKLKGNICKKDIDKARYYDDVAITSSSGELIKVISEEGVQAFVGEGKDDMMMFSRNKN